MLNEKETKLISIQLSVRRLTIRIPTGRGIERIRNRSEKAEYRALRAGKKNKESRGPSDERGHQAGVRGPVRISGVSSGGPAGGPGVADPTAIHLTEYSEPLIAVRVQRRPVQRSAPPILIKRRGLRRPCNAWANKNAKTQERCRQMCGSLSVLTASSGRPGRKLTQYQPKCAPQPRRTGW